MRQTFVIFKRELKSYFSTPVAYVFLVVFLFLLAFFTFQLGGFYNREQADMVPFFSFHPWLYLFLIPAIAMRLWSEERRSGTIELLCTLPVTIGQAVVGKFLAAWAFTAIALALTFPMWMTVNYLGDPDNGVILASYLGSFFMAGAYLAIGSCFSAITKSQVIAFVLSALVCFFFVLMGHPAVLQAMGTVLAPGLVDAISGFSFLTHFEAITRGVVDLRDVIFFGSLIAMFLYATTLAVDLRKAA